MKTKGIRQSIILQSTPEKVYKKLASKRDTSFSHGKILKLEKDKKIIQKWSSNLSCWPQGHFSKVVFSIEDFNGQTLVRLNQLDVPEACSIPVSEGWHENFWKPMKTALN